MNVLLYIFRQICTLYIYNINFHGNFLYLIYFDQHEAILHTIISIMVNKEYLYLELLLNSFLQIKYKFNCISYLDISLNLMIISMQFTC